MVDKSLIIFVKNPESGSVKTRIANEIGKEAAVNIYNHLLDITRRITNQVASEKIVYYSDFIPSSDHWCNDAYDKKIQHGDDLGQRMFSAMSSELKTSDKVVLIGSDCPYLTPELIVKSFEDLNNYDFTFGPARDGGYYLVGARMIHPGIFKGITWSSEQVLDQTIKKVEELEFSYNLQPVLADIDYLQDWNDYLQKCRPSCVS